MIRVHYGAIVEGVYDVGVFEELIPRLCPYPAAVTVKEAGGRTRLMSRFPRWLRMFEHSTSSGGPVERALVIRDANGRDPADVETDMRRKLAGLAYGFRYGVEVHAVRHETETWLLADTAAISRVAGCNTPTVDGQLENRLQAKEDLMGVLSDVALPYTPEVCRRIASMIDLPTLRVRCPSFGAFERKVILEAGVVPD